MTKKSRIAQFKGTGDPIQLVEISVPELKEGEILVKNEYTTLCRSDLNTFSGKRKEKTPTILGHEIAGKIEAFGPGTSQQDARNKQLKIGDRITWTIYASNPETKLAKKGIPQKAPGLFKYGHEQVTPLNNLHGGLSDYTILRANTAIARIKKEVPLQITSIINCAVATVAGSLRLAGKIEGKNILISGAGMLGIIACAMCKTEGAKNIIALDINPPRLENAKKFGANVTVLSSNDIQYEISREANIECIDVTLDFSGVAKIMEQTLELLTFGGVAVWVGATHPQRDLHISAEKIIRNLWIIKGLHNYNEQDFIKAVTFIENYYNNFPFTTLVHDKFTLSQVNEAFDYALIQNPFRTGIQIK